MKKTKRIYTPISSIKELVSVIGSHGDKTVFKYLDGKEYKSVSYKEFHKMVLDEVSGFRKIGLAGERIAVIGETSVKWLASYVAILASGGVAIPMDKELDIEAIEGFLEVAEAKAIIYSQTFNAKLKGAMESHKTLTHFLPMHSDESTDSEKVIPLDSVISEGEAINLASPCELTARGNEELAVMLFTSGTTGTSKCVMLCEKNICSTINAACETVEFFPDDTIVSVLPVHHTYELTCLLAGMDYGMMIGINDSLRHIMKNFAEFKPTGLVLVPLIVNTMYNKIMGEVKKQGKEGLVKFMMKVSNGLRKIGIDLRRVFFGKILAAFGGRINKIVSGAAPLNPEMMKQFDALGITIAEGYGITECSPLISVNPYFKLKSGSVGPAVPSCTVRIDVREKNDKGFDEGEIQVKGDNVMLGYYGNEEENKRAFTEDGWYRTGDVGYMDKDGYIYITGRLKSVIVLENGKNVFPEEIEEYLSKIPEIGESVVVGRKAEDGETILLTVIAYPNVELYGEGYDKEKVHAEIYQKLLDLNRKLPTFKHIKALELRDEPFEKTTTRKIKRHLVK